MSMRMEKRYSVSYMISISIMMGAIFPFVACQSSGIEPKPYLSDVFSTAGMYGFHLHSSLFFTRDGDEIYFTNQAVPVVAGYDQTIFYMKKLGKRWSMPIAVPFSGKYSDCIFHLSRDGRRLYFTSTRPVTGQGEALSERNGWIAERTASGWGEPRLLQRPENLKEDDGPLYVSALFPGGMGGSDIYRLEFQDGHYGMPENLGASVNSAHAEHACCVPVDERFIIFYRYVREDRKARGLYISLRNGYENTWSDPVFLSGFVYLQDAFCATLSPDEKRIFILNRGDGVYSVSTALIEKLSSECRLALHLKRVGRPGSDFHPDPR